MGGFSNFFVILLAGLFLSSFFNKFHFPWVITLIIGGIIIGPFGLGLVEINETIEFIGETGLVLLMFMAGLESKLAHFEDIDKRSLLLPLLNGLIPFVVGFVISMMFGFGTLVSVLIGIIFVSSSIAIVVPTLEANRLMDSSFGRLVLMSSIFQDVASLVLLSVFLQTEEHLANLPLIVFYPFVLGVLIIMRYILPRIQKFVLSGASEESELFHRDIRVVLAVLFGIVIVFELLGLHPIIAGFFAGMVLSDSLESKILQGKIRAISYGIFIPTFFVLVGTRTNLGLFVESASSLIFTAAVIVGSMGSKFISGVLGGKLIGYGFGKSAFIGSASIPQLSTTLAATFAALEFGILTQDVATAMVALSVVTTAVGPLLMSSFNKFVLRGASAK